MEFFADGKRFRPQAAGIEAADGAVAAVTIGTRQKLAQAVACRLRWPILAAMPELIAGPTRIAAAGEPTKLIEEYVGAASTGAAGLSIAHMRSPSGWAEPGQRPEFDEFTVVLHGALVVESESGQLTATAGQGVHARSGEWVRYSTPGVSGAEYISVCVPAFSPGTVHRDN
jgi:mannose-6-phosphate isomerase-like protein (cupin superfamily)